MPHYVLQSSAALLLLFAPRASTPSPSKAKSRRVADVKRPYFVRCRRITAVVVYRFLHSAVSQQQQLQQQEQYHVLGALRKRVYTKGTENLYRADRPSKK